MKMWRGIAHILFGLSIAASFVGVIYGAWFFFDNRNEGLGFLVLIGGTVVVLVAHTVFGMFIELCNNIAAIRSAQSGAPVVEEPVLAKDWKCSACGAVNDRNATFCSECGNRNNNSEASQ